MLRLVVVTSLLASLAVFAAAAPCSPDLAAAGACFEASNNGSQVDVTAGMTVVGGGGSNSRPDGGSGGSGGSGGVGRPVPAPAPEPEVCGPIGCRGGYEVATIPDVTLADLASFRPVGPTVGGEPAGFGIAGLPTNLVVEASEQIIPGALFGYDVRVRFVPAGFVFDHGDGTSARSQTGGASWTRLGQAQFTPTSTSHVYGERGTYRVNATVQFVAAVDFGGGWRPVAGYVTASGGGYDIRVLEASTALVNATCAENPTGPGC